MPQKPNLHYPRAQIHTRTTFGSNSPNRLTCPTSSLTAPNIHIPMFTGTTLTLIQTGDLRSYRHSRPTNNPITFHPDEEFRIGFNTSQALQTSDRLHPNVNTLTTNVAPWITWRYTSAVSGSFPRSTTFSIYLTQIAVASTTASTNNSALLQLTTLLARSFLRQLIASRHHW